MLQLVRRSGGLSYIIDELGAALAVDLQDELMLKASNAHEEAAAGSPIR